MASTQNKNTQSATPETVWALLQELALSQKKMDKQMQQMRKDIEEMAHNRDLFAGEYFFDSSEMSFAEEYFFKAFEGGKHDFFGERFDDIDKRLKGYWQGIHDEYDIVLFNHESVAIVEAKCRAHEGDVAQVLRKAETFRVLFPNYRDHKIYLGLASTNFPPELERRCIGEGIAVIKQVGDAVVVNDANLKVF